MTGHMTDYDLTLTDICIPSGQIYPSGFSLSVVLPTLRLQAPGRPVHCHPRSPNAYFLPPTFSMRSITSGKVSVK